MSYVTRSTIPLLILSIDLSVLWISLFLPNLKLKNIKRVHALKDALDERIEKECLRMCIKADEFMDTDFDEDDNVNT